MSLAMRQARYAQGDPGFLGFLGGLAKGAVGAVTGFATGGPAGAIIGGLSGSGLLGGGQKPVSVAKMGATNALITSRLPILQRKTTAGMFPQTVGTPTFSGVQVGGPGGLQIGTARPGTGATSVVGPTGPGVTGAVVGAGAGTPCASGYHYNKTRYYSTRYGVVEKGSVCVKNRRRNPLNPRALSRAMSRIKSAQKAVRCLGLFAGAPARAAAKTGGRFARNGRKSCGGRCRK